MQSETTAYELRVTYKAGFKDSVAFMILFMCYVPAGVFAAEDMNDTTLHIKCIAKQHIITTMLFIMY